MMQSKLVKHLAHLSKKDRDKFKLFVDSPYFNHHQKTKELLEIILQEIEGERKKKLGREQLFKQLFPRESYDDNEQQLHNVMSYLKKLFHRFLAVEQFEKEEAEEQLYTIEHAKHANQIDLMKNRARQLEKKLDKAAYKDSKYHYLSYRLNNLMGFYKGNYEDRSSSVFFQNMLDHFDRYYLIEKLKNCCHLLANSMIVNTRYDFGIFEALLKFLSDEPELLEQEPTVNLYYTIVMTLLDEQDPSNYQKLKQILNGNDIKELSHDDVGNLYTFAYNYCIRMINQGKRAYQRELFELYKEAVKKEFIIKDNNLSEWDYKNIVTLGCKLKEFEWTEKFIYAYKDKLPDEQRENAFSYNLGNLYYNKKQYNEAIDQLNQTRFTDVKYHLNTNFLMLRTYYDQQDTVALLSLIETFRVYVVRNKKMTNDEKRGYTNFLRFAKKLALLRQEPLGKKERIKKMDELHKKIEQSENVINKYWLLEESQYTA